MAKIEIKMDELGRIDHVGVSELKGSSCSDLTADLMKKIKGRGNKVTVNTVKTCEFDQIDTKNNTTQSQIG